MSNNNNNNLNKVFIGNLPQKVDKDELVKLVQQYCGTEPNLVELKRGFAFVAFSNTENAQKTIGALNGYNIMGSQLLVEPSTQNRRNRTNTLQISNIPERYPWDDIHRLLVGFGNIQTCDKGPTKTDGTYAVFVTYETPDQAQQAHHQLNNSELQAGVILKVDFMMNQGRGRGRGSQRGGSFSYPPGPSMRPSDFPLRILVLSDMVGAIIGRSGGTIRQITQQTRARVDVHRKENAGSPEKVITIYGNPENCSNACQKILEVMQQESNTQGRGELPLKILAHNNLIGRIIGKSGSTIKRIMEQTETKIAVSSSIHDVNSFNLERVITVKGKLENISKAEQMISGKLRQSYENDLAAMAPQTVMFPGVHPLAVMSTISAPSPYQPRGMPPPPVHPYNMYGGNSQYMMYQNSVPQIPDLQKETVNVYVPNGAVGAIIGTGGSTIRDMISSSNASIKIAQTSKDEAMDKSTERKVSIIGTPEAQWKAQYMIFKKVSYEGFVGVTDAHLRVEILVPSNQVGRIIGKGGQNVRELQRMTHATIKFPENSKNVEAEEIPVHIIGDFYSTQAAQRQIRTVISRNIFANSRRRAPTPQQQPPLTIPV